MNIPTTIKIAITAYGGLDEDHAAFSFTYEVNGERPEAAVLRLAAMLIGASLHGATLHGSTLRGDVDKSAAEAMAADLEKATLPDRVDAAAKLTDALMGIDPKILESDSLYGIDTDLTAGARVVEAVKSSRVVPLIRVVRQVETSRRERGRAVRSMVIDACDARLAEINGVQVQP